MKPIYLDYASTTPADPAVIRAMEPYHFEKFGNATSVHAFGREASGALEDSRRILADFIRARPDEIVFTSGASEANNHAICGVARALGDKGKHIILSKAEHHSVREPVQRLEEDGFQVTYLELDPTGMVNPREVAAAITRETILIAVIHANNEIGTIQPVAEIGQIAKAHNIIYHIDAVQTVGHIPVDVNAFQCDMLSLSAHKFYGPKGIGALYIRSQTSVSPLILGGDQERGRRASTPNIPGIVGLAKAVDLSGERMDREEKEQSAWRDHIIAGITRDIKGARLNGHPQQRLPNNIHFCFDGINGEELLMQLDLDGLAASRGSACTAGSLEPSYVLKAIGLSDDLAKSSLRLTLGRWTTDIEVRRLLQTLPQIITRLRK